MKKILVILLSLCVFVVNANVKCSNRGKNFIKSIESLKLNAYEDGNGYSIGYGHHSKEVSKNDKITKETANRYFEQDIKRCESSARRLLKELPYEYKFSQGFIDGFISLIYNCGENGVRKSTFFNKLKLCRVHKGVMNDLDYNYVCSIVKYTHVYCKAHKDRRIKEFNLMRYE